MLGKWSQRVPVATLASGHELSLTLLTVDGARPGPRVGISAMIHGDELDGLLILRRLWESIEPTAINGTLVLLPVANPLAMEQNSRNTPTDMLDMNRLFPGTAGGWLSEQIAHRISTTFIDGLDALIDIHAGGSFPWVDYCYVGNDLSLSRAFLSELLYRPEQWYHGTSASYAISKNVPTVVVEIGGGYQDQAAHVANGIRGVNNCLRHTGTLNGPPVTRPQLLLREMRVMRPRHGGLCLPRRALVPGTRLGPNEALADIVSPYTFDVLETMVTPFEDNVVVLTRNYATRIHPGDYGFMIGNASTATLLD
jgi:hypothetical protein